MGMTDELKGLGVNVDEGLARLNGNKALYERLLVKLTGMVKNAMPVLDSEDSQSKELIEAAHAIKGSSGNLSVTPVYEAYSQIVSLLRAGQEQEAREQIQKVRPVQEEIIACIEKYV